MAWLTKSFINEFVPAGYDTFVETGTSLGRTVDNLKDRFVELHSIELSEKYYNLSRERFKNNANVNLYKGSSDKILIELLSKRIDTKFVFWLDAHWSAADTAKGDIECPLLRELRVIKDSNLINLPTIFIDDVRLFCKEPPKPYAPAEWCNFSEVVNSLLAISKYYTLTVHNDILVAWTPQ